VFYLEENHKSLLNGTIEKNKDPPGTTVRLCKLYSQVTKSATSLILWRS